MERTPRARVCCWRRTTPRACSSFATKSRSGWMSSGACRRRRMWRQPSPARMQSRNGFSKESNRSRRGTTARFHRP
jgi:hypothetical protein